MSGFRLTCLLLLPPRYWPVTSPHAFLHLWVANISGRIGPNVRSAPETDFANVVI